MKFRQLIFLLLLNMLYSYCCLGQGLPDSVSPSAAKITQAYINTVDSKSAYLSEKVDKQTGKYLASLEKQEQRLMENPR